ncbi:MAG: hypothetical protein H7067_16535 [Burkholderiales bacterium]|nr:hypothetical protein [Opitutaceae bacterium]
MKSFSSPPVTASPRRGSALIAVIILTTVSLIFVGSLIGWSLTERRLTIRNALLLESRNAAEALAEYGFAQIQEKYETRGFANLDPDGTDALVAPPTAFWANSNVNTASGLSELVGGTVLTKSTGTGTYFYIDPANPNNDNDPLKGKWVWRRDVSVIAKATVSHPTGADIVSYATQSISVRGAPLFAHAIFYNMDLEIFPGPEMHIYGPVHANGDVYLSSQGSASLNFHGQVTAAGNIYHSWKHGVGGNQNKEGLGSGNITFVNRAGAQVSMRVPKSDGTYDWNDSRLGGAETSSAFRSFASETWNGNVLTAAHGVTDYKPVAVGEYREADPYDPSVALEDDDEAPSNSGRLIIEPPAYPTDTTAPDYAGRMEIEAQKYSNDAGIYIKVTPPATVGGTHSITVSSRSKTDPTKNKNLILPVANEIVKYGAYKATATYSTSWKVKTYEQSNTRVQNGVTQFKYKSKTTPVSTSSTITYGSSGNAVATDSPSSGSPTTGSETGWLTALPSDHGSSTTPTSTNPSTPVLAADNKGLYDRRRKKGVDLVDVDMDALRKAVAQMAGTTAKLSTGSTHTPTADDAFGNLATADWTGIVYIEVAGGPTTDPTTGATNAASATAATQTAVRILKGKGKVPSHGTANEGLTLATNAPMYVQGNYNADGTISTATATHSAHVPETGELPAALVADSITLLSEDFDISKTLTTNKPGSSGAIEVAAALLMGITPTNPTLNTNNDATSGESSGGAHNFPRFLETWGHATYIRGSLVSLFESRVATEPWSTDYYGAPGRNWGFNDLFSQGHYPPGTPRVMSYRRVDFTNLDATSYDETKESFNW